MIVHRSIAAAEASVITESSLLDGGTIECYTAPMPATTATAMTTQTKLGTLTFGNPAFLPGSVDGAVSATAVTQDSVADASGLCAFIRCKPASGAGTHDLDVSDMAGNGAVKMVDPNIVAGLPITVATFTFTAPLA